MHFQDSIGLFVILCAGNAVLKGKEHMISNGVPLELEVLKELIRFCREQNVASIRQGSYEIVFQHHHPVETAEAAKLPVVNPEDVKKAEDEAYAKLMFMSSGQ